jgi:G3E family GTPase
VSEPIIVTVIGGYLGAGKTTLVNHILRTADRRVAVLVNDFGDVDIDADLIESADGDTISLANGCICCSLVDGFAAALNTIKELDPVPQRLVIEASGVADPASVAAYGHGPGLALDAVVVLVDAETVRRRAVDKYVGDTVLGQLRSADIVVMNKLDLIDEDAAAETRAWLRSAAPEAAIIDARNSEVESSVLFGAGGGRSGSPPALSPDSARTAGPAADIFQSWTWTSDAAVERARIDSLMAALPDDIVRAKGLIRVIDRSEHGGPASRTMILQRVGRRWTLVPAADGSDVAISRCVFIGMRSAIDERWLDQHLPS